MFVEGEMRFAVSSPCGLILAQFNLAKCCKYTVTVSPMQYDGGSMPLAPGEIHDFYRPVGSGGIPSKPLKPLPYMTPVNPPQQVEKITITLNTKDREPITEVYIVPKYRSKVIVNITRVSTSMVGLVSVTVTNLKNRTRELIRVVVDNLRKR